MNAHQRRKLRRLGDARGQLVSMQGFVRMVSDHDPEIYRPIGQLYENTSDSRLRVTIDGRWVLAENDGHAKRLVQEFLSRQTPNKMQ